MSEREYPGEYGGLHRALDAVMDSMRAMVSDEGRAKVTLKTGDVVIINVKLKPVKRGKVRA